MCTALSITKGDFYFGRNLDIDRHFGEKIVITPRNMRLEFKDGSVSNHHPAFIGMAAVVNGTPLYAEALNEKGLAMAGLNFPVNAKFSDTFNDDCLNLAPYEIISWTMANCSSVKEARMAFEKLNFISEDFIPGVHPEALHHILSDRFESIVIESTSSGIHIYDNPEGILTNNPEFPVHMKNIKKYHNLTPENPVISTDEKKIKEGLDSGFLLKDSTGKPVISGMGFGAKGLPGDFSPASRFIKTAFLKKHAVFGDTEESKVSQFFDILEAVKFVKGSVITDERKYDITLYSCCINGTTCDYYYKTFGCPSINVISMKKENLEGNQPIIFDPVTKPVFNQCN